MRYWICFVVAGVVLVGLIAYLQLDRVADTLVAVAVFAAISVVVWEPLQASGPDRD
jgi:hypothetical protein